MSSKRGKRYSAKLKAQVVLEVLQSDQSVAEVARAYTVHPNTIHRWKEEFLEHASDVFGGDEQLQAYEQQIAELEQLLGKKEVEIALLKNFLGGR